MKTAAGTDAGTVALGARELHVMVFNSVLTGGGVDTQTLSQCQALLQQGAHVTLVLSHRARWIDRARAMAGLQVVVLSSPRWQWPLRLIGLLRRDPVHVLHAHHGRDYWVALLTRMLVCRTAVVVVTRHLMTALKPKTRRYLALADRVVAVSQAVLRVLEAGNADGSLRLACIHCGIDTDRFRPASVDTHLLRQQLGLPADAWIYAVVGAIHAPEGKGQFHFVRAASAVLQRHPEAFFLVAGSGEAAPALADEARALGLGDRFRLRAFGDDVVTLMQALDVLVHPAVSSEALGLVLLEALACGKPVIGSALDGVPETFDADRNGLLVPPRDVPALAHAMNRLADDPALARAMGEQGPPWVRSHFGLDTLGVRLMALYRQALLERAA